MVNKIKITKEQYNRIFASKLISENHIKEKGGDLKAEVNELVHYLYGVSKEHPRFLDEYKLKELCHALLKKGIIKEKEGHYEISTKLGTIKNAKEIIGTELKKILTVQENPIEEDNYPVGVDAHTHDAPWNQPDNVNEPEPERKTAKISGPLKTLGSNEELSILSDGTNLFVFLYGDLSETPVSGDKVGQYMSAHKDEIGYGLEDWASETKRLVQIDNELRQDLINTHSHDKKFVAALNEVMTEITSAGGSGFGGSSGPFVGALSTKKGPIKRELNTPDVPVVYETTTASPSTVGPYDANALQGINRDGSYKKTPKTNAEKKTQWAGGSMVSFDDCTKLNNNKEAQNGGCSTGAVDNVVKQKKTSSNVNAPSLKGG